MPNLLNFNVVAVSFDCAGGAKGAKLSAVSMQARLAERQQAITTARKKSQEFTLRTQSLLEQQREAHGPSQPARAVNPRAVMDENITVSKARMSRGRPTVDTASLAPMLTKEEEEQNHKLQDYDRIFADDEDLF